MKKLAVISNSCPFGLSVNSACKIAADSVDKMQAISDLDPNIDSNKKEEIIKQNQAILNQVSEQKPCKYAAHIFPNKPNTVDCDWGDTAAGQSGPTFTGSNYYEQLFNGVGFNGLYAVPPMSGSNDPYYMRNLYYGLSEYASPKQRMQIRIAALKQIKRYR